MLGVAAFAAPAFAAEPSAEEATTAAEATAQESGDQPNEEAPVVLETITVTAQKREENLQDVPVAATVLGAEELRTLTAGGPDVRFLSGRVPSLKIESSFGRAFPRFYIRGLGNTDFDLNASQPVSMVYDEVVLENPIVKGMPIWDMDRVEVLRGPQGTLFGRNTPAGVVKFESVKPSQEKDAYLRASYGRYGTRELQGAWGGPLGDTVSARLSVLYQGEDDWVDNAHTGQNDALGGYDNSAIRLQFLFEPNDRFTGLLNLHAWDVDGTARIFRANILKKGTNDLVDDFRQDTVYHDGLNSQDISAQGGSFKLDYDFGSYTLTSVTGFETLDMYSRGDIDGGFGAVFAPPFGPGFIPFYSETADGIPSLNQFTEELRIASNPDGGKVDWLGGLFYFSEDLEAETFSYTSLAPGNPLEAYAFQSQEADSWAAFASVDIHTTDRMDLQLGVRYTDDQKDFAAERTIPTFLNTETVAPITRSTDANNVSWDASLTYEASDDVNIYGRIATGFRAPSVQGRILFCPDPNGGTVESTSCVSVAKEEDILSYEFGVKSELLDNRLRVNATAYTYTVDDQQIVAVGGGFNTATLLNADTTDGYGLEADIQVAPSAEWLLTIGASYNHTEIDDPNLVVAPCGGGCTVLDPVVPGGVSVDGNSLPHAPELIFNGVIDYRKPMGNGNLFTGSLDWAYHDDEQFFLYESAEFHSDGLELGLRLAYAFNEAKYEVALFGRNILDEEIVRGGIDFNNLTGFTNEPAIWGVEFSANFF